MGGWECQRGLAHFSLTISSTFCTVVFCGLPVKSKSTPKAVTLRPLDIFSQKIEAYKVVDGNRLLPSLKFRKPWTHWHAHVTSMFIYDCNVNIWSEISAIPVGYKVGIPRQKGRKCAIWISKVRKTNMSFATWYPPLSSWLTNCCI